MARIPLAEDAWPAAMQILEMMARYVALLSQAPSVPPSCRRDFRTLAQSSAPRILDLRFAASMGYRNDLLL